MTGAEPKTVTTETDWPALIDDAAHRLRGVAHVTPLAPAPRLSRRLGATVLLKREDQQPVFSFKLRGAFNRIACLDDAAAAAGVICSSAGNHAQGVALAARMRGIPATVVMPRTTPSIKVEAVRDYGAEVILHGDNYDAAQSHAHEIAEQRGRTFIHPFDDVRVIAGQATIGRELLDSGLPFSTVVVPIGGGGLAAGIALAIKAANPETRIIGVEPAQSASMLAAFEHGAPVTLPRVGLFADGVAVRRVGDQTYALCREFIDEIVTVDTDETCAAIRDIYEDTRTVVEPAGALAVAGVRHLSECGDLGDDNVVAIVCGANLNFDRLRHIAERAAIGEHREALFAVRIEEQPGSFRAFCNRIGDRSVTEFNYRYAGAGDARIFVGIELSGGVEEGAAVLEQIRAAGYPAEDLSHSELAKLHVRHLVGGRAPGEGNERVYRFEFPERPGALGEFLDAVGERWNISLFHYRNHGSDYGRVLAGIQVDDADRVELDAHLDTLGYPCWDETDNPAYRLFLT